MCVCIYMYMYIYIFYELLWCIFDWPNWILIKKAWFIKKKKYIFKKKKTQPNRDGFRILSFFFFFNTRLARNFFFLIFY